MGFHSFRDHGYDLYCRPACTHTQGRHAHTLILDICHKLCAGVLALKYQTPQSLQMQGHTLRISLAGFDQSACTQAHMHMHRIPPVVGRGAADSELSGILRVRIRVMMPRSHITSTRWGVHPLIHVITRLHVLPGTSPIGSHMASHTARILAPNLSSRGLADCERVTKKNAAKSTSTASSPPPCWEECYIHPQLTRFCTSRAGTHIQLRTSHSHLSAGRRLPTPSPWCVLLPSMDRLLA